jgi:predicted nucleic acid-binding protein
MRYVLDASVSFKWVVPETDSAIAIRLWQEYQRGVHRLLAPDVYPIEVAHSLTRAERRGRIAIGQAAVLWGTVLATPPMFARSRLLLPRAIAISSAMQIGVYDCLYVALAERRKCELVTADDRLVANLRPHFPFIVPLSSLPGP